MVFSVTASDDVDPRLHGDDKFIYFYKDGKDRVHNNHQCTRIGSYVGRDPKSTV